MVRAARAMATATRVAGDEEGNGDGGRSDGDGGRSDGNGYDADVNKCSFFSQWGQLTVIFTICKV